MFWRQFTYRWKFPAASAKCRCQSSAVLEANRINEVAKEREWVRAKRMRNGQISMVSNTHLAPRARKWILEFCSNAYRRQRRRRPAARTFTTTVVVVQRHNKPVFVETETAISPATAARKQRTQTTSDQLWSDAKATAVAATAIQPLRTRSKRPPQRRPVQQRQWKKKPMAGLSRTE